MNSDENVSSSRSYEYTFNCSTYMKMFNKNVGIEMDYLSVPEVDEFGAHDREDFILLVPIVGVCCVNIADGRLSELT